MVAPLDFSLLAADMLHPLIVCIGIIFFICISLELIIDKIIINFKEVLKARGVPSLAINSIS